MNLIPALGCSQRQVGLSELEASLECTMGYWTVRIVKQSNLVSKTKPKSRIYSHFDCNLYHVEPQNKEVMKQP